MHFLVPLAGLLGIEIEVLTAQLKRAIIVNTVMALLFAVGLLFIGAAAFLALAQEIGSIYAALWVGGVAFLLALLILISTRISQARRRRIAAETRRSSEAGAFVTTAAITALPAVPTLLKSPVLRTIAVPAALATAFFLARRGRQ